VEETEAVRYTAISVFQRLLGGFFFLASSFGMVHPLLEQHSLDEGNGVGH
jgi:hypothetical protein